MTSPQILGVAAVHDSRDTMNFDDHGCVQKKANENEI